MLYRRLSLIALTFCVLAPAYSAVDFYVAPNGKDTNPGTIQQPFATLQHARDAIRALKQKGDLPAGGVTVYLRGGIYYLPQPLELTKEDSGTAAAPITYRAYGKEQVWLDGGTVIPPSLWRPVKDPAVLQRLDPAARGHVMQVDLTAAGVPPDVAQLPDAFRGFTNNNPVLMEVFSDDQRMQLARWPNKGFARFGDIVDTGSGLRDPKGPKRPGIFKFENARLRRWHAEDGIWMLGYWARAYLCTVVKVGKIDQQKQEIQWAVPLRYGLDNNGAHRFYVLNVLCELDTPGEWYLNRKTHILYYWPPKPLAQSRTVVSRLATPMVSLKGADYVTFRRLGLEDGRQDAIDMNNASHNRVIACTIRNVGMSAVIVNGGVDDGVQGCDIHDTGYSGVRLSGGDRQTLTPCNHFVDNCHIYNTSIIVRTEAGPISLKGVGLRASHNLIHHEPHTAIWFDGNDILIEYNEIYSAMLETTEGGVLYTGRNWTYRGNIIRYNYIHDIPDTIPGSPTRACILHEDDCASGTTFYGNLCVNCGEGVAVCGGPDNITDNNIFIQCKDGVNLSARGLDWWSWTRHQDGTVTSVDKRNGSTSNPLLNTLFKVPYNKPPYTKYPHLANILKRDPIGAPWYCRVTRNIAMGGPLLIMSSEIKPQWVTIANNWDNAGDPGFVDAAKGNYNLRPDAPVIRKIGFVPLPLDKIGLVNDGTRASWPVHAQPAPANFKPNWLKEKEQEMKAPTALPVVAVPRAYGKIVIDGKVNPEEWAPAGSQSLVDAPHHPVPITWDVNGKAARWPSKAWLEVDDNNLYVAFINQVDPTKGVSGGHAWGKDDAVEIAISALKHGQVGDIIALRGFTDGTFTSSNEAGAPEPVVKRALQGTQYACQVQGKGQWTAEWKIPFSALGVQPQKHNPRLLFNLSVRKPAGDLWVMWKKGGGYTWQVRNGGVLWLRPFGDMVLSGAEPSQANIHVIAATPGLTLKPLTNCEVATWSRPVGGRVTGGSDNLSSKTWRTWEYAFVPDRDGRVSLNLMGRPYNNPVSGQLAPVWTYYDDITCQGAKLVNGDFEQLDSHGQPAGWSDTGGLLITTPGVAASGHNCVKVWHNGRFVQTLQVKKGQPVKLSMKVRGEAVPAK